MSDPQAIVPFVRSLPLALGVIGGLFAAALAGVLWLVGRAKKSAAAANKAAKTAAAARAKLPAPGSPPPALEMDLSAGDRAKRLRAGFGAHLRRLRQFVPGPGYRYKLPWYLLVGEGEEAGEGLLSDAGLNLPFGPPDDELEIGCRWWLLDRGVVIDLAEPGRFAGPADPRWREMLALVLKHRPERPLDGVVFAVPGALLAAARRGGAARAELEDAAERLHGMLSQAQKQLGFRLPIYVVVTGCEVLPGFSELAAALPESLLKEAFGWSTPYRVETSYRADWVTEALARIGERLRQAQVEILAQRLPEAGRDEFFLFPNELLSLEEPLRRYLDPLLRASGYQESVILRGIYVSGRAGGRQGGPHAPLEAGGGAFDLSRSPRPGSRLFLRDLFDFKIFPEAGLAVPMEGMVAARTRAVRIAQVGLAAAALFLALGTAWGTRNLIKADLVLVPFLDEVGTDIAAHRDSRAGLLHGHNRARAIERVKNLIDELGRLEVAHFGSLFLPASWVSDVDHRLRGAIRIAFEEILFEALRHELERRVDIRLGPHLGHRGDDPSRAIQTLDALVAGQPIELPPVLAFDQTPEWHELASYVNGLAELDSQRALFNRLGADDGNDLQRLAELLQSLFGVVPGEGFFSNSGLYRHALAEVQYQPFAVEHYQEKAAQELFNRSDAFDRALFVESPLKRRLAMLDLLLEEARGGGLFREGGEVALERLIELLTDLDRTVSRQELAWAFQPRFGLGPGQQEMLTRVTGSAFLGPEAAKQVERRAEAQWIELRNELPEYRSPLIGSYLRLDEAGLALPELSPDLQVIKRALEDLEGQDFMASLDVQPLRERVPIGTVLEWDTILLDQAVALHDPYERFRAVGLGFFPAELRRPLDLVARRRLELRMVDLVARAQRFDDAPAGLNRQRLERDLGRQVASFGQAAPALNRLLGIFEELQLWEPHGKLKNLVSSQGLGLLRQVDGLLEAGRLYAPEVADFSWWDGTGNVAFAAFGVADAGELAAYLGLQRREVQTLARDLAEPLLAALGGAGLEREPDYRELSARWERILDQLEAYDKGAPGNSVALLENHVAGHLAETTLASCSQAPVAEVRLKAKTDYFLDRRRELETGLAARCQALAGETAALAWVELGSYFRNRLEGRYPFGGSAAGAVADPRDIKAFFERFDRHAPLLSSLPPEHPRFEGKGERVQEFIRQMGEVRAFFTSFLALAAEPGREAPAPAFDVAVEFRVNREKEIRAERIIRWRLVIGEREIRSRTGEPTGRWALGQPLRLELDWAADGPTTPALPADRPGAWVDGRTAIFSTTGPWALVQLLTEFRAPRRLLPSFEDSRPHTLEFAVDNLPANLAAADLATAKPVAETTRVFLRLELRAPDDKAPLTLPHFPWEAPRLEAAEELAAASRKGGASRAPVTR